MTEPTYVIQIISNTIFLFLFSRTTAHRPLIQYASSSHKKHHVLLIYQAYAMYNSTNSIIIIHSRRNPAYLRIVPKSSYVFQHPVPAQAIAIVLDPEWGEFFIVALHAHFMPILVPRATNRALLSLHNMNREWTYTFLTDRATLIHWAKLPSY